MQITPELIQQLGSLSRLSFSKEEESRLVEDLQQMLNFVDKLSEVETAEIEPLMHVSAGFNTFRKDEPTESIDREEMLKRAPGADEEFFRVPKVIKRS
ncbi:Asp-tRNA(Asn)/Glu-tRNA(Gln) amidotransferase subunit GatC [Pontibacter sp. G13]|uniref:Asp-tRNA(Asn)/Glu-tRNA(Gln) amidotransferase subunit GatC n=1 Tax=Pontibacter sp. G13 TaxID=3074898 RepID=UPI00288C3459|nr:Asp-tRNA(Asn)/Glu-tRNA(Gln) amidotransferase subunit GatC [Pontibacter sp. G13]WNJ21446.1 Asp-tRNA(Asn)/Glu-tRNA(Gln) amidotransferase subunit GatC [Pontibacter sp. G13]